MSLKKITYVDKRTPIDAKNLNDIQDAIISAENSVKSLSEKIDNWTPPEDWLEPVPWNNTQVWLLNEILNHIKYDGDETVGQIVSELISSLQKDPRWKSAQVDLLDELFNHVKFLTPDDGHYADLLIESLRGMPIVPSYIDANEVEY